MVIGIGGGSKGPLKTSERGSVSMVDSVKPEFRSLADGIPSSSTLGGGEW